MTSSRTPDPAERVAATTAPTARAGAASPAAPPASAADRIPPLRLAVWLAVALALGIGVALYFRHRGGVVPVIGGVAAESVAR